MKPLQSRDYCSSFAVVHVYRCLFNNSKCYPDFGTLQSLTRYATPLDIQAPCFSTDWPTGPLSSKQNCLASPICWKVNTSLSDLVNKRLKWTLANLAHLPWSDINRWCFQGRWVIKWNFSRDYKRCERHSNTAAASDRAKSSCCTIPTNILGCITTLYVHWGDCAPMYILLGSRDN